MSDLKPCPFCGKEVFLLDVATRSSANAKWDVYCRTHGCFLNSGTNNMFSNREEAFIAWNTRTEPPELSALRGQVRVLREALEACIDLLSNLENIGGFVGLAVINNGQTALDQTKPKDGK